ERRQPKELARLNALRDADDVLRDDAAGPQVQVSDFAVAHLPRREPDGKARGLQQRVWDAAPEAMPRRCGAELDGVAVPTRAKSPAVQHNQHDRGARGSGLVHIEGDAS